MKLIQELENIGLRFVETYYYDAYYFSHIFEFDADTCVIIDDNLCDKNKELQFMTTCQMISEGWDSPQTEVIVMASLSLTVGRRKVPFFCDDDILRIRSEKKLKVHSEETLLEDFTDFIDQNSLTYSFKLVFLLQFLDLVDRDGECSLDQLADGYRQSYMVRLNVVLKKDFV